MRTLRNFIRDESGQDMVEYALLASLVAVVSVAGIKTLGTKVLGFYTMLNTFF